MRYAIDTGPLVALLCKQDKYHQSVVALLSDAVTPLITTAPVLSEAMYLLKRNGLNIVPLCQMLEKNLLQIEHVDYQKRLAALLKKYEDLPTSVADASLVVLCEKQKGLKLLTMDSDFEIYRREDRTLLPLVKPSATIR